MKWNHWLALVVFLFLVFLIEWGGHQFTFTSLNNWYANLKKPSWTPPSWLFGIAWTILYLMIGVSGWLAWIKTKNSKTRRFSFFCVYGAQLIANLLWSYLFFFLKSPLLGLIDIVLLITLIGINLYFFTKLSKPAGLLLIPYLAWTIYAFSLNLAIWKLN